MALFEQLSRRDIRREFTHRGWVLLCPVYVRLDDSADGCVVQERNGIPEWWLEAMHGIEGMLIWWISVVDPFWEPRFMLLVTGPIARDA